MTGSNSKPFDLEQQSVIQAFHIAVQECPPNCPCQQVHIVLQDIDGDDFASASMSAQLAREFAARLTAGADQADLRLARKAGQVS